jgi:hypothetical protein
LMFWFKAVWLMHKIQHPLPIQVNVCTKCDSITISLTEDKTFFHCILLWW